MDFLVIINSLLSASLGQLGNKRNFILHTLFIFSVSRNSLPPGLPAARLGQLPAPASELLRQQAIPSTEQRVLRSSGQRVNRAHALDPTAS